MQGDAFSHLPSLGYFTRSRDPQSPSAPWERPFLHPRAPPAAGPIPTTPWDTPRVLAPASLLCWASPRGLNPVSRPSVAHSTWVRGPSELFPCREMSHSASFLCVWLQMTSQSGISESQMLLGEVLCRVKHRLNVFIWCALTHVASG